MEEFLDTQCIQLILKRVESIDETSHPTIESLYVTNLSHHMVFIHKCVNEDNSHQHNN